VSHSAAHHLDSPLAFEAETMPLTCSTADHREAVAAFMAKQKPVFEGR
jgi:2-(1,2-epoxy-1,2-dihydrophenyl)acetyl-CoA isomerase